MEEEEEYAEEPSFPKEIILQLMANRFQSCSEESMKMNEILEKVGFDSQFAEDFANHIEVDPLDMSLWDWIRCFVVSTLDRLWMKCSEWQDGSYVTVGRRYEGYGMSKRDKKFMKKDISEFLEEGDEKNVLKILAEEIGYENFENLEIWFHGTIPEYAEKIIKGGIVLSEGKANGNFSHKDGFYLTDDFEFALSAAFKKYCHKKCSNQNVKHEEIAVLVFAFDKNDNRIYFPLPLTKDVKNEETNKDVEVELGIDLRPTKEELANDELERPRKELLENIVFHFSRGAPMQPDPCKAANGLEPHYKEFLRFIVGPFTSFKGHGKDRAKQNIEKTLKLTQLCLRRPDIKAQFEEIMNPIWLFLRVPQGYTDIISDNEQERKQIRKGNASSPSENFVKYGAEFSRQSLFNYTNPPPGKTQTIITACFSIYSGRHIMGSWIMLSVQRYIFFYSYSGRRLTGSWLKGSIG